jgi:fructokinase
MPEERHHRRSPDGVIACVGEALIDLISTPTHDWSQISHFTPRIGGAPANASVAIQRLGGQSRFIGCLADDAPADWIRQRLGAEGVDISRAPRVIDAQTRLAAVTGPIDQRSFSFYGTPAADSLLTPAHIDSCGLEDSAAIMLGSLLLLEQPGRSAHERVLEIATERSIPLVFDPNPRPALWPDPVLARERLLPFIERASILKLGTEEPAILDLTVEQIRSHQPQRSVLVLTDGARGCWYWYGDAERGHVPAIPVNAVDSTGAGDAFTAALTLGMVERGQTFDAEAVRFAAAAGALATTGYGAMDALPCRDDIQALLDTD